MTLFGRTITGGLVSLGHLIVDIEYSKAETGGHRPGLLLELCESAQARPLKVTCGAWTRAGADPSGRQKNNQVQTMHSLCA